jgi:iron complex outermembrane receptor protein
MNLTEMRLPIRKLQIIATACYLTVFFFLSLGSTAQSKVDISGIVTDDKGSPLSGASVVEKNTANGVITNAEGRYTIKASANSALVISFTGYRTLESPLNGLTSLDVKLTQDLQQLDDVVVTGYGTQIRKEITSSVVTVNSKEFNKGNIGDPIQLLQGKVGGLQIGRAGGNPNQPFTIRLRGLNTLSGDPSPLIVIDGILGGALDALDPNDIASVEVLKDASAAAIYGARASAGVIIVTTKSGKGSPRPQITYTGQVSFDQIAKTPRVATPEEYIAYGGQDLGSKTDWLEEVTRTGVSQVHNLTFYNSTAGGFSYNVSLNYRNTNSIIDHSSSYEQLNARANLSQRFWQNKLMLSAVLGTTSRTEDQGYQQSLSNALYYNPTAPVYDSAGNFYETKVQIDTTLLRSMSKTLETVN